MNMEASTFLVCKKSLNAETLLIIAARLFGSVHIADQVQRLLISLSPATQDHDRPIGGPGKLHLLQGDERAWLATRPQGSEAEGDALPCRYGAQGCAAGVGPAYLVQRGLQRGPITLAVPQKDHLGPRREHLAHHLDHGDMEIFRK